MPDVPRGWAERFRAASNPLAPLGGPTPQGDAQKVDVWFIPLSQGREARDRVGAWLSTAERERASRFVRPEDGSRYVMAHGCLRAVLAGYLEMAPGEIAFDVTAGKPALAGGRKAPAGGRKLAPAGGRKLALSEDPRGPAFTFNLTHSGDWAACAVTRGHDVGIDLEQVREIADFKGLVNRVFSQPEQHVMASMGGERRLDAFFRGWTRKEAVMKATGQGLALPPEQVEVSLEEDKPATVVSIAGIPADRAWTLVDLATLPGWAGAVAVAAAHAAVEVRSPMGECGIDFWLGRLAGRN